ncbi:MAG: WG repeat-containing protein, partial [Proteobacteria bacterium]
MFAISNEPDMGNGSKIAYVNNSGDTIIPFGKYGYFGTDTLVHFANVLKNTDDNNYSRPMAISRDQKELFDLELYDNYLQPFHEGLIAVSRNGKMGYANKYGQIVIPCTYDYAGWFENGRANVTFNAVEYLDGDDHLKVDSDEWFEKERIVEQG